MFDYFTLNNLIQFIKIICNIAIVWMAFYFILKIVKNNSRTIQIFKGILLIFIIKSAANLLGLNAVERQVCSLVCLHLRSTNVRNS